ncbi:MAG TPA: hypothetical protein DHV12_05115 [Thermotogae bacterium]|nr:hypothetical protein [Thermotogota bacterium]
MVARDGKGEITKGDVWSFTTVVPSSTWERTYGGNNDDEALSIQQTVDGGYIVAGYTKSSDAGIDDFYVIKLDPYGARVWEKMYGGSDSERAYSVRQTADGGYIVAGYTKSFGVGEADVYIVKLNNSGEKLWNKTYGGSYNDEAYSIQQTADEGYIVAGFKCSSSDIESADVYILKLDSDGNKVWEKTFGGDKEDIARSVQQTEDGGYIVAGWTNSSGNGEYDVYILKLDSDGNKVWEKTFGGSESDWAYSIQQTVDGGYIVVGYTYTFGTVWYDVYVLKLNSEGNIVWEQTFGDSDYEYAHSVKQTADGGYILAGYVFYPPIKSDVYILKLGSDGNKEWEKTYSGREGSNGGIAYSIQQTVDGGYVVAGACEYPSGSGGNEVYILKLNDEGGL